MMDQQILYICWSSEKDTITAVFSFPDLPCHTQAVERCMRLITEACASVCESKDGFINSGIE